MERYQYINPNRPPLPFPERAAYDQVVEIADETTTDAAGFWMAMRNQGHKTPYDGNGAPPEKSNQATPVDKTE